jgi:hypothetical protein
MPLGSATARLSRTMHRRVSAIGGARNRLPDIAGIYLGSWATFAGDARSTAVYLI